MGNYNFGWALWRKRCVYDLAVTDQFFGISLYTKFACIHVNLTYIQLVYIVDIVPTNLTMVCGLHKLPTKLNPFTIYCLTFLSAYFVKKSTSFADILSDSDNDVIWNVM